MSNIVTPFEGTDEEIFRASGAQLRQIVAEGGRNARVKAAKTEIERRKANSLAKKASAPEA